MQRDTEKCKGKSLNILSSSIIKNSKKPYSLSFFFPISFYQKKIGERSRKCEATRIFVIFYNVFICFIIDPFLGNIKEKKIKRSKLV